MFLQAKESLDRGRGDIEFERANEKFKLDSNIFHDSFGTPHTFLELLSGRSRIKLVKEVCFKQVQVA